MVCCTTSQKYRACIGRMHGSGDPPQEVPVMFSESSLLPPPGNNRKRQLKEPRLPLVPACGRPQRVSEIKATTFLELEADAPFHPTVQRRAAFRTARDFCDSPRPSCAETNSEGPTPPGSRTRHQDVRRRGGLWKRSGHFEAERDSLVPM